MLIASVVELGLQVVVLSGIVWVVTGTLNLAFLIAAVAMIMRFAEPMAMFISYTSVVELIASALQRIEQFMAVAPLPVAEQSEMPERYDIRFDNVSYRYEEGDGHALNHVSLTFPAASMSALVGASGAGKTTVTKLLMRYADPQQGQISIGGVDIRRLTPEQLNSLISVVFGMSGCLMTRCWRISVSRAHRRRDRRWKRPPALRSALSLFPAFRKAG